MPRLPSNSESKIAQIQHAKELKSKQLKDKKENNKKARVEKKKEQTYCNDCKKYINTQIMPRHILTQKHIDKNVSVNNSGPNEKDFCLVCSGSYTKTNISKHEKTAKHLKALRERKQN